MLGAPTLSLPPVQPHSTPPCPPHPHNQLPLSFHIIFLPT
jgi:hypothetical protein